MSTATQIVDRVEDLWPAAGVPDDALAQLVLASNLLGANRAVSNFGGGNTSAKGDGDRPRRARGARDVGQGLGLRPGHHGPASTSPGCGSTRCCRSSSATR